MKVYELEADVRQTIKFSENFLYKSSGEIPLPRGENVEKNVPGRERAGGILKRGEWAWMAHGKLLKIVSLRNSQVISTYEFSETLGYDEMASIKQVEELLPDDTDNALLAILIENVEVNRKNGSYLCVFSVNLSSVLGTIELPFKATCMKCVGSMACRRTLLQNFDGCVAVGSEEGALLLVDLNIRKIMPNVDELQLDTFLPCYIVDCNLALTEIHRKFRICQQDGIHFVLKMEVVQKPTRIYSILPIDGSMGLAIGIEDGRLIYYDLIELQIIHVAAPLPKLAKHPIVRMAYIEDVQIGRPGFYLWAMHENYDNLSVVMHVFNYKTWKDGADIVETFEKSYIGFQMQLEDHSCAVISCQALRLKCRFMNGYEHHDLCMFSWHSHDGEKNKMVLFDLTMYCREGENEENMCAGHIDVGPSYWAHYILNGSCKGYDLWLHPDTLTPFISPKQLFEGHFYPNSLSFDCYLLHNEGCRRYNWEGAQSQFINILRSSSASIFLDYKPYYENIKNTRLQGSHEITFDTENSRKLQYEVILSTALEHNCVGLLRDCAKSWIDGSYMGNLSYSTGLSLSILTDWAWQRFKNLKEQCDNLKRSVFERECLTLRCRVQKELPFKSRQIKLLADLFQEILTNSKHQIPEKVFSQLENQHQKMHLMSNYYDLLLWLINIGLLPELSSYHSPQNKNSALICYPYKDLCNFYKSKRENFAKICDNCMVAKTGHCRLLYIDYLLEYQCKIQSDKLYGYWYKDKGKPLYPPNTIQSMIDIMLVPDIPEDTKYAVLLYFLLDLNMAIDEKQHKNVVANLIKFPSVFKLSAQLIKTVQSFWNLDHDHFGLATDEFISPFNKDQKYDRWQVEMLIEVLLLKNATNLSLRILETQGDLITPEIKLRTLLDNDLISEAFHFVRSKQDNALLGLFFTICLGRGQFGVILDLSLTEKEGLVLQYILRNRKFPGAESLHFVYLLQKSKYLDAVAYLDELSKVKQLRSPHILYRANEMDTPNMVLSAFNTTLTPLTQSLTDVYFKIKNKIKQRDLNNNSPVPLSCQLIKQNANSLSGGIYHSSALGTHFATYYWGERDYGNINGSCNVKQFMKSNNVPFLRRPQMELTHADLVPEDNIAYPRIYKAPEKRTFIESELQETGFDNVVSEAENPSKRRRLIGIEIIKEVESYALKEFPQYTPIIKIRGDVSIENSLNDSWLEGNHKNISQHRPLEIHGILKTSTTNFEAKQDEDEKNLRFQLPITHGTESDESLTKLSDFSNKQPQPSTYNSDHSESQLTQTCNIPNIKESPQSFEKLDESERHLLHTSGKQDICQPLKLHFNTMTEKKYNNNSITTSDDEYYSPVASLNSSAMVIDSYNNTNDLCELSKQSLLSGPQPRKPLSRLSAENEDSDKRSGSQPRKPFFGLSSDNIEKSKLSEPHNYMAQQEESSNETYTTALKCIKEPRIITVQSKTCTITKTLDGTCPLIISDKCATSDQIKFDLSTNNTPLNILPQLSVNNTAVPSTNGVSARSEVWAFQTSSHGIKQNNETSQASSSVDPIKPIMSTMKSIRSNEFLPKITSSKLENKLPAQQILGKLQVSSVDSAPLSSVDLSKASMSIMKSKSDELLNDQLHFESCKINEFLPKVSSVAVYEAISKIQLNTEVKLSECTTIVSPLTSVESENVSINTFIVPNLPDTKIEKTADVQECNMIDTTLSMSTCDFTSMEQFEIERAITNDMSCGLENESLQRLSIPDIQNKAQIDTSQDEIELLYDDLEIPEIDENGIQYNNKNVPSSDLNNVKHNQSVNNSHKALKTEDVCIILSSSSSSISSPLSAPHKNEFLSEHKGKGQYSLTDYEEEDEDRHDDLSGNDTGKSDVTDDYSDDVDCSDNDVIEVISSSDSDEPDNTKMYYNMSTPVENHQKSLDKLKLPEKLSSTTIQTQVFVESVETQKKNTKLSTSEVDFQMNEMVDTSMTAEDIEEMTIASMMSVEERVTKTNYTLEENIEIGNQGIFTKRVSNQGTEKNKVNVANEIRAIDTCGKAISVVRSRKQEFSNEISEALQEATVVKIVDVISEGEITKENKEIEIDICKKTEFPFQISEASQETEISAVVDITCKSVEIKENKQTEIDTSAKNMKISLTVCKEGLSDKILEASQNTEVAKVVDVMSGNEYEETTNLQNVLSNVASKHYIRANEKIVLSKKSEEIVCKGKIDIENQETPFTLRVALNQELEETTIKDGDSKENLQCAKLSKQNTNETMEESHNLGIKFDEGSSIKQEKNNSVEVNVFGVQSVQAQLSMNKLKKVNDSEKENKMLSKVVEDKGSELVVRGDVIKVDNKEAESKRKDDRSSQDNVGNKNEELLNVNLTNMEGKKNTFVQHVKEQESSHAPEIHEIKGKLKCLDILQDTPKVDADLKPRRRYSLRGSSMPPSELEDNMNNGTPQRLNKRGESEPPDSQIMLAQLTPETRLKVRARSLQTQEEGVKDPRNNNKTKVSDASASSAETGKISKRRCSNLLESIAEDSPSSRTRSRVRLSSVESELNVTDYQKSKRINETIERHQTPKRQRRISCTSQPDAVLPRNFRASSITSFLEGVEAESIPPTPTSTNRRRPMMKGKKNMDENSESSQEAPLSNTMADNSLLYSSARRLTRNQLALIEKSNALAHNMHLEAEVSITPPSSLKKISNVRSTRSTTGSSRYDSDGNESVSSRHSGISNISAGNRRVTRSSVKDKEEIDDDSLSVASSIGSDYRLKAIRSKDKKSPNTTLSAIPEDSNDNSVKERRGRTRGAKH